MKPTTRINSKLKVKNLQYVLEVREILEIEIYQQEQLKCHSVMIPGQISQELTALADRRLSIGAIQ